MVVQSIKKFLDKNNFNNKRKIVPIILVFSVFIINTVSLNSNIQYSENSLSNYFTVNSINSISANQYYTTSFRTGGTITEILNKFEIYDHSILTISGNNSVVYTFDQNFKSIISTQTFTFSNLSINDRFMQGPYGNYSFRDYTNRITTDSQKTFILGNYIANGSNGYYNLPKIDQYGGFNTTSFTTYQSELNVPCIIPNQFEKFFPDTCYTNEIKLLNSSVLLFLQNYVNEYNINNFFDENIVNVYGTSLVFYDLNSNTILQTIILPESNFINYEYIFLPNSNDIWIYFINAETQESGYLSVNQRTGSFKNEYASNLNSLQRYTPPGSNYYSPLYSEANFPLIINSKMLIFYQNENIGSLYNYIWYNIQVNYANISVNFIVYILIIFYFVFIKKLHRILSFYWRDSK